MAPKGRLAAGGLCSRAPGAGLAYRDVCLRLTHRRTRCRLDGMHGSDLDYIIHRINGNIAMLAKRSTVYTQAHHSSTTDSPAAISYFTTGASPKTTGLWCARAHGAG